MKLLRVLQDQTFEVLGDSRPRKTDIRVVSATNADLRKMVGERTFREDLFYRINLITVKLPALRERREDIPFAGASLCRPSGRDQRIASYGIFCRCLAIFEPLALSGKYP